MKPDQTDTLIIGGGIIGLLTAYELLKSGKTVTILEKNNQPGLESSWAGGGILSPLYPWRYPDAVTDLAVIGHKDYPRLAVDLLEATGVDPEYVRSGHLILDTDEHAQAKAWAKAFSKRITLDKKINFFERIGRHELELIEPELSDFFSSALWMPVIGQVRNPCLIKALQKYLELKGVNIVTGAAVTNIQIKQNKVEFVETAKGSWAADSYLVAAGAWTSSILSETGLSLEIQPVRGQMLLFKADPGKLRRIILHNSQYLIPRRDGHILAGSTLEYVGFEKETTKSAYRVLRSAAIEIAPFLSNIPIVKHWAGLRPGSSTGVPTIANHPGADNLVICSGHFRNGVIIGLGSARIAASLLTKESLSAQFDATTNPYSI